MEVPNLAHKKASLVPPILGLALAITIALLVKWLMYGQNVKQGRFLVRLGSEHATNVHVFTLLSCITILSLCLLQKASRCVEGKMLEVDLCSTTSSIDLHTLEHVYL